LPLWGAAAAASVTFTVTVTVAQAFGNGKVQLSRSVAGATWPAFHRISQHFYFGHE